MLGRARFALRLIAMEQEETASRHGRGLLGSAQGVQGDRVDRSPLFRRPLRRVSPRWGLLLGPAGPVGFFAVGRGVSFRGGSHQPTKRWFLAGHQNTLAVRGEDGP